MKFQVKFQTLLVEREKVDGNKMRRKLSLALLLLLLGCTVFTGCADKKADSGKAPEVVEDQETPDEEVEFEEQ